MKQQAAIGDLVYLSGAEMGKRTKAQRKEHRKEVVKKIKKVVKKVAKVGLTPARAAFITLVTINAHKLATHLAAMWKTQAGQQDVKNLWAKFQGDINVLKKAIAKGSKTMISGDDMGIVVTAAMLGAAAAIIKPVLDLIKKHKVASSEDHNDLQGALDKGMNNLATSADVEKTTATMDEKAGAGILKDKTTAGSFGSIGGFLFKTLFIIMYAIPHSISTGNIIIRAVATVCVIGIVLLPFVNFTKLFNYGKKKFSKAS